MDVRVTTVSREESTVGESPAAVFVISQEMIRRSGARNIPEVLRMVPGLDVARIDGNKWAVSARGFNDRFRGLLLVQIDGRTVYSPVTTGTYWDTVNYPLEDIDRIEVIRGPGATVWGANAVNGIINIITKSSKDTQGGMLSVGGGNMERGFTDFRFGGRIGDHLTYRAYGMWSERTKEFSLAGNTNDQWREYRTGLRLDWQPNDRDTFTFEGDFFHSNPGRRDNRPTKAPPFFFDNVEDEVTTGADVLARWTHEIDKDSNWSLQFYWDSFYHVFTNDPFRWAQDTYDVDFQHQFRLWEKQRVIWGLGYRLTDIDASQSGRDGGFIIKWFPEHRLLNLYSAFLQDEISLVEDRLTLTLGSKIEHNDFTGFEVQPSGRLLWTPTKQQSAWLAVSRAVRTPSLGDHDVRFTQPTAVPGAPVFPQLVGNPNFRGEDVLAYELGYRTQATDKLSVDVATFYNVYDNLQVLVSGSPRRAHGATLIPVLRENRMDGETYGVELAATWQLTRWWRLFGAYSYLKMNLHADQSLPPATARSAEQVQGGEGVNPENQFYLQSSWDLPWNVEFDLIGRYVDRLPGFPGSIPTIESYVSLDARLAWRPRKNLELAVVGQNLLDSHHPEFGTSVLVHAPLVELRRGLYGKVTVDW
jgi:iron complex outermembrane recepter protein